AVHTAGAGLPDTVAVAIAMGQAFLALLAISRSRQAFDLELHQSLDGKADHLAQQIGVGGPLHKRPQIHPVGRTLDEACSLAVRPRLRLETSSTAANGWRLTEVTLQ